jgi:hypothetical protein
MLFILVIPILVILGGGSSTLYLPGRNEFLSVDKSLLNNVVNNVFYNISKVDGKYPLRNFTTKVLLEFMKKIEIDWLNKYGDPVLAFESLVEKPRTGDLYIKAGWTCVGETKGYTCKRNPGKGTDSWTGKRVWNTDEKGLKPKLVFCYTLGKVFEERLTQN